jgi:hypothetical protein
MTFDKRMQNKKSIFTKIYFTVFFQWLTHIKFLWEQKKRMKRTLCTDIGYSYTLTLNHLPESHGTIVSFSFLFIEVWATTMWIWWRAWSMFIRFISLLSITREQDFFCIACNVISGFTEFYIDRQIYKNKKKQSVNAIIVTITNWKN